MRSQKLAPAAVAKARALRRKETEAERRLWNLVRNRSVAELKFVRQYPVGPFVVDFACRELMLVIEADGGQHADSVADEKRTAFLNSRGYSVLRFWNSEVLENLNGVFLMLIAVAAGAEFCPSPGWRYSPATLSPEGRGDVTENVRNA